jgi:hypothetical protein
VLPLRSLLSRLPSPNTMAFASGLQNFHHQLIGFQNRTLVSTSSNPRQIPAYLSNRRRRIVTALSNPGISEHSNEPPIPEELEAMVKSYLATDAAKNDSSPISYAALGNAGRLDLIEPIMNAGGYISVSKRLGIPVDESFLNVKPSEKTRATVFDEKLTPGSLALGRGREDRLSAAIGTGSSSTDTLSNLPDSRLYSGPQPVIDPSEMAAIGKNIVEVRDDPIPQGERLALDTRMRAGTLILVACSALAYGSASNRVFDATYIHAGKTFTSLLVSVHVVSSILTAAVIAPSLGRNRYLWAFKVLLSGPLGLASLQNLGEVELSSTSKE